MLCLLSCMSMYFHFMHYSSPTPVPRTCPSHSSLTSPRTWLTVLGMYRASTIPSHATLACMCTNHHDRLLQLFLISGQTYFQPPDLIDLIVRSKASRRRPYTSLPTPSSTKRWRHPRRTHFQPHNDLCNETNKAHIQHMSTRHLTLITRSSFHQSRYDMSQGLIRAPALGEALFRVPDHAKRYLYDRAMVAFEMWEKKRTGLKDIRTVFPKKWEEIRWCIWWWAGSEEKARMEMERLRETVGSQ